MNTKSWATDQYESCDLSTMAPDMKRLLKMQIKELIHEVEDHEALQAKRSHNILQIRICRQFDHKAA